MYRSLKLFLALIFAIGLINGCGTVEKLFNPFVGKWVSGAFILEFNTDDTFELKIGKTISVNLEGTYTHDESTLTLNIEGDTELVLSYEFKDDKNTLVLKPENESSYISTTLDFKKE